MLIYDDTPIFDCNPLVGSGTGPSAPNTDPLYCRGCAPCAMPRLLPLHTPLSGVPSFCTHFLLRGRGRAHACVSEAATLSETQDG